MSTAAAGLVAYPATIEEGLAAQAYVAPRTRRYARPSSRGEYLTIGLVAVTAAAFVGLVLIPYVRRVGGAQPGWPWLEG
ncbi:MAG: hypothetical protein ACREB9_00745 [Thermoplasmata archaeon]